MIRFFLSPTLASRPVILHNIIDPDILAAQPEDNLFNSALSIGEGLYESKKYDEALECFKGIVKGDIPESNKYKIHYHIGLCLRKLDRSEEAIGNLMEATKLREICSTFSDSINLNIAKCFYSLKRYSKAIEYFDKIEYDEIKRGNSSYKEFFYEIFYKKAICLIKEGFFEDAIDNFIYAEEIGFHHDEINITRGLLSLEYHGLNKIVDERIFISRNNLVSLDNLEKILENSKKAFDILHQTTFFKEKICTSEVYNGAGLASFFRGHFSESIENFDRAIEKDLNYGIAYYNKAVVSYILAKQPAIADDKAQQYEMLVKTLEYFKKAIDNHSAEYKISRCYIYMAKISKILGNNDEAGEFYSSIIDPTNQHREVTEQLKAYIGLGELCIPTGALENARTQFKEALRLVNNNKEINLSKNIGECFRLANSLLTVEENSRALKIFTTIINEGKDNSGYLALAYQGKAKALAKLGIDSAVVKYYINKASIADSVSISEYFNNIDPCAALTNLRSLEGDSPILLSYQKMLKKNSDDKESISYDIAEVQSPNPSIGQLREMTQKIAHRLKIESSEGKEVKNFLEIIDAIAYFMGEKINEGIYTGDETRLEKSIRALKMLVEDPRMAEYVHKIITVFISTDYDHTRIDESVYDLMAPSPKDLFNSLSAADPSMSPMTFLQSKYDSLNSVSRLCLEASESYENNNATDDGNDSDDANYHTPNESGYNSSNEHEVGLVG